ncbi:MAG: hypothetical protein EHM28_02240 [Spirochaetaceae bacterium]|nr:MAG: hypothetical protein EHM28_02240 [Spirochaetaceae bacterium]
MAFSMHEWKRGKNMGSNEVIEEKIGEGLMRIGAMAQDQVSAVLKRQKNGDPRLFGEIAVDMGFVDIQAVINYLQSTNKRIL